MRPSITGKENQVRVSFTIGNELKMIGEGTEENYIVWCFTV
jgi:hypothetical protein